MIAATQNNPSQTGAELSVQSITLSDAIAPPVNHAPILDRLADVQLPAEPSLWPAITIISAIIITVGLVYLRFRRRQTSSTTDTSNNAQQALERLAIVEKAWADGEIDARETAYRLNTLLRLGLNLPQLNHRCPAALADHHHAWQQTQQLFNQLRYQPHTAQPLNSSTFNQVRLWLSSSQQTQQGEHNV